MTLKPIGIDDEGQLPVRARAALAGNLADVATPEGAALLATIVEKIAAALADYDPDNPDPIVQLLQVGDSLTENWGNNSNNIELKNVYGASNVLSIGKGGQTSPQIAGRQGGVPVMLTVAGGKLPATGGVGVTPDSNLFYMNATTGTWSQDGTLAGVAGTLSLVKTTGGVYTYTFTRAQPGAEVATPNPVPFRTGFAWRERVMTICVGRNDFTSSTPQQIVDRIRAIIEWSRVDPSKHLVLSIPPSTAETPGSSTRTALDAANAAIKAAFPRQWVDWAGYLTSTVTLQQAGITPTAQDATDIGNGVVPASFRGDNLHYNAAAYDVINTLVLAEFAARGVVPLAPVITTGALAGMTVGVAVSQALEAVGGTPFTWSIVSGSLPSGVSLSSGGALSGTPTAAGAFEVTIRATNGAGTHEKTFTGSVAAASVHGYGLTDASHRYVGAQLPAIGQQATPWPDAIGSMGLAHTGTTMKVGSGPGGVDKSFDTPVATAGANTQRVFNTTGDASIRTIAVVYNNRTPANIAQDLVSVGSGHLKIARGANGTIFTQAPGLATLQAAGGGVAGWRVGFAWYDESSGELGIDIEGTETTLTGTRGAAPGNTFAVGGAATSAIDLGIAEVITFNRVLTDAERATVRNALAAHYPAITV